MNRSTFARRALLAVMCLLLVTPAAFAQAFGSVNGTVRDQRGDAVARATITLTNTGTNATRTVTASKDGVFQLAQVLPGTYELQVEASGFKSIVQRVVVQVNTPVTLELTLDVGEVTEVVEVAAGQDTINQQDATIGNTFGEFQIRQLPIEGRNVVDLLSLQPGVTKTAIEDPEHDDQRSGAVNGARADQSNVTLDGVDVNDQQEGLPFTSVIPITLDSVQEFRVTTSNANADQGRGAGAQVALVTKSGTNAFHGSVYEFHRNTVTTANSYFNNLSGVERPKLLRNVFGASLGGPFVKDRFFFFVNYEGRRDAREDSALRLVPSETLRQGIVRYENTSGGITTLTPSDIATEIDPLGIGPNAAILAVFNQYPLPNDNTAGDGLNVKGFRFKAPVKVENNTYIARADFHLNDRNLFFWRGNLADNYQDSVPQFPGGPPRSTDINNSRGFALGYTALVSGSITNVFRYGLTRQGTETGGASLGPSVRFRGLDDLYAYTRSSAKIVPTHNLTDDVAWVKGNHTYGFGLNFRFIRFHSNSFVNSFPDTNTNSSWLDGTGQELEPGNLRGSFEVAYLDATVALLGLQSYVYVPYNYDRDGNPQPIGSAVKRDYAANEYELYVQDSWKLRPNLTLSYGLRYSLFSPPYEQNGLQVKPTMSLADWAALRIANAAQGIPASAAPDITFDLAGPANGRPGFYDWDKNNFAPRVAVAWSPGFEKGWLAKLFGGPGRSSLRGGFGVYYEHIGAGLANTFDSDGSVGLSTALENPSGQLNASTSPRFVGFDTLPPLPAAPPGGFPASLPDETFAITFGLDDHIKTPIDYSIDVSFSRELPGDLVIEAAYVGRFARNRLAQVDLAQPVNLVDPASGMDWYTAAGLLADSLARSVPVEKMKPIPYFENLFPGIAGGGLTATQRAYRVAGNLAPDWTFVQYYLDQVFPSRFGYYTFFDDQYSALSAWRSIEDTNYNAGQFMIRKRFGHGVTFDFNYTYSKSIDLTSENERTSQFGSDYNSTGFIINQFDKNQNRAVSDFDTTHAINANWLWELPVGRGRAFLPESPGWVDAVVGGWQLTGVLRATSGFPVSVGNGRIWPTNWNISGWATATGDIKGHTTRTGDGPNLFDNVDLALQSFANTRAGQSGDRNIIRGDGFFTLDFGLGKDFRLPWEGHRLQFRWEVFNATNTARFDVSSISLDLTNSGTFGRYQETLGPPRVMQFGLRYEF